MLVRLSIITLIGLSPPLYFPPPFPGYPVYLLLFACGTRAVPPPFRYAPTTPRAAMSLGLFECPFDSVSKFTRFLNFWVDFYTCSSFSDVIVLIKLLLYILVRNSEGGMSFTYFF
jgi:hypothetical protein